MWEIRVWKLVLSELSRIGSFLCLSGVLLSREKVRRGCTLFSWDEKDLWKGDHNRRLQVSGIRT